MGLMMLSDFKRFYNHVAWILRGVKVFALIGRSGTGKSFRAQLVAQKYGIDLIIDDGLLIKGQKILAGKSAKKEKAFLTAIRTALFDDRRHREDVRKTLEDEPFKKILIIGTSERMVHKIAERLGLPTITKVVKIEEIATEEEIETAINSRKNEGKHVIPVPAVEVKRNYSSILLDTVRVFFKKNIGFVFSKDKVFEKSVVRPEYGKRGRITISEPALTQMVLHCADEYDQAIIIKRVIVKNDYKGYKLKIHIHIPFGSQISGNIHEFQSYVIENLERYTGIMIASLDIIVDDISTNI